jgi:hypothetical protein
MATNNGKPVREFTEAEIDAMFAEIEAEPKAKSQPQPPTSLREAAYGRWVIAPPGFVPPQDPHKNPVEVGSIVFRLDENQSVGFFVTADVLDDKALFDQFVGMVLDEFPEADTSEPGKSFMDISLHDVDLSDDTSHAGIGIHTIAEMKALLRDMQRRPYLLQDHIPVQTLAITVGDSGIGKSPLMYELGMCIASGKPFLGIPTTQGRVLYLDYENNIDQIVSIAEAVAKHLGLRGVPDDFQFWSPASPEADNMSPLERIRQFRPALVIIDTLSAAYPQAEAKNENAATLYSDCRGIMKETGCTIMFTHHRKKPPGPSPNGTVIPEPASARDALRDTRGASALINGADARWIVTRPRNAGEEVAFTIGGYLRGRGEHPTISVGRDFDEDGNAIGHNRVGGTTKLSDKHRKVYDALPDEFRWKDLSPHFIGDRSKQLFRDACYSAGVLEHSDGTYWKKKVE